MREEGEGGAATMRKPQRAGPRGARPGRRPAGRRAGSATPPTGWPPSPPLLRPGRDTTPPSCAQSWRLLSAAHLCIIYGYGSEVITVYLLRFIYSSVPGRIGS
jgi:hypothetical protein